MSTITGDCRFVVYCDGTAKWVSPDELDESTLWTDCTDLTLDQVNSFMLNLLSANVFRVQ